MKPKRIHDLDTLRAIIAATDGDLFVRWSRGAKLDRQHSNSRDYQSGQGHVGLSAVPILAVWATDDRWLARRVTEYQFLRLKDEQIGCHIYKGQKIGTDSDGYALITGIEIVGTLTEDLINYLTVAREGE